MLNLDKIYFFSLAANVENLHKERNHPDSKYMDDVKQINTKLLILHGAKDPFVPAAEVATFQKELDESGKNYEFVVYSGAVHAFTIKAAGNDVKKGAAYNEQADSRSFIAMKDFLKEVNQ